MRRFFPSRPTTQTAPGQTVEIEIQIPENPPVIETAAPEPACVCDVDSLEWVPRGQAWVEEDGGETIRYLTLPNFGGTTLTALDIRLPDGDVERNAEYFGLPLGPSLCGVIWTWSWDTEVGPNGEAWADGYRIEQVGPHLYVALVPTANNGAPWSATLTATANCEGGDTIGALTMIVRSIPS